MNKSKIITIFSGLLLPNGRSNFRYKINGKGKRITGLFHSNKAELSLSFYNESELEINSLVSALDNHLIVPPSKRIISWEQDIKNCALITGNIKNLDAIEKPINLYLIIEQ